MKLCRAKILPNSMIGLVELTVKTEIYESKR